MPKKQVKKIALPKESKAPEIKPEDPEVQSKVEQQVKKVTEEILGTDKTEFRVLDSNLKYVRTYTVKDHGPEAEKLAKQFAAKIGGWAN